MLVRMPCSLSILEKRKIENMNLSHSGNSISKWLPCIASWEYSVGKNALLFLDSGEKKNRKCKSQSFRK